MNNKQKLLSTAVIMACGAITTPAQANLTTDATLQFTAGTKYCAYGGTYPDTCKFAVTATNGSFFSMDNDGSGTTTDNERIILSANDNLILGATQPATGSHTGAPDGSESPGIDNPWAFFTNTGMHQTTSAITIASDDGAGAVTLDMSGWSVTWNGIADIPMGGNSRFGADTGIATLTCANTCEHGDTFVLNYAAHVADAPASGFEGVPYGLYLEGTVFEPNEAPVANPASISSLAATSHPWTPSVSDSDTPAQTLACSIVAQPADGTASVATDCSSGSFIPTTGAGFTGSGTFTYIVNDTRVDSDPATVSYNISTDPVPVCNNFTAANGNSGEASVIALNIGTNCSDSGGSAQIPTTVAVTTPSTNGGTVTVNTATQVATYTPATGFSGTDTFTYTVSDSTAASSPATVTITVNAKNLPGIADGTFSAGTTDTSGDTTDGIINTADIGVPDNGSSTQQGIAQSCIGGCFDFIITGVTGNAQIVLPLSAAIPTPAAGNSIIYRKLKSTGWVNFDTSGNNGIHSVAGTVSGADIICPPATDSSYDANPGLTTGDHCVRLTIVDDGPNDNDATAGTVADPGGIAESFSIDTRISSTDGCSMSGTPVNASQRADWWLVAGFMALLGMFRLKRNKV